jgi:hypothetical protein
MVIFVKLLSALSRFYLHEFTNRILRVCLKYFEIPSLLVNSRDKNRNQPLHRPAVFAAVYLHHFSII